MYRSFDEPHIQWLLSKTATGKWILKVLEIWGFWLTFLDLPIEVLETVGPSCELSFLLLRAPPWPSEILWACYEKLGKGLEFMVTTFKGFTTCPIISIFKHMVNIIPGIRIKNDYGVIISKVNCSGVNDIALIWLLMISNSCDQNDHLATLYDRVES